ncbi:unnamed protein product [Microthlaspi erraticum]|uniref:mRNA export factor GLE1 n=1 Tax=Microthlaspi erraticum TaxID=1685480 RepID=A0A6D2J437_9BRAS|nr:unnamed protein product [Microthlaspi erraticum]
MSREKRKKLAGEKVVCNGQAADIALTMEKERLKKLEELQETNKLLKSGSNQEFSRFENRVKRVMKQISGTEERVTANINDLLRIFNDPSCPVSISIATLAKKMVSSNGTLANPYACSYVVVYVTSKFPQAMDVLLAEFHRACVYTIPRNDDDDTAIHSSDYYERIDSVMRLYGALVQTDVGENIHGIDHGWAWLARFLNKTQPHNKATATALNAFLRSAGFGLHRRYRCQFLKLMSVVREHFLAKLIAEKDDCSGLQTIVSDITAYLDDRMYLEEPQGRSMRKNHLRSRDITGF